MRHLVAGLLSSVLLSSVAIAPAVKAETVEVTPFQLVSLAQDGYFQDQGIPHGGTLITEMQTGQITSTELVRAAIDDGRLTANTLQDRSYLDAVTQQMRDLTLSNHDYQR